MSDLIPVGRDLTEYKWSADQLELIKRTVAKGQDLNPDELLLFGYVCKQSGLDPFLKQVYPVKFKDNKTGERVLNFITGINGYRTIAERTGIYAGRDDYLYDSGLTQFQMIKKERKIPYTCTVTVYKMMQGIRCPTTHTCQWSEYYPKMKGKGFMWDAMPYLMLGKTTEAGSLRTAFPQHYKGIYLDSEFDQSEARPNYVVGEDNVDLINELNVIYKDMLGYNPAQIIAKNIEITGDSELNRIPKEKLEILKYQLEALTQKNDGLEGESQNVYQDVTEEK